MKYLIPYLKRYKKESIIAPLFKMLEASFDLAVPLVVADIINVGIPAGDRTMIFRDVGLMFLMAVLGLICSFTAQYFAAKAAIGTGTGLRHQLMDHIQNLSLTELDRIGSATLITRMTSDINLVQNGYNMFLRLFLRSPFIVFGALILAFLIDWHLALIFVGVIGVLLAIVFGTMAVTKPLYKKQQQQLDKVTGATRENLAGVRVIRAFGSEENQIRDFENANHRLLTVQKYVGKLSAFMNPLTYVTVNTGIVAILWLGAKTVQGGTLLSGDIVALINYIGQILIEVVKLANLVVLLGRAAASMERVGQVLDTESSMAFPGDARQVQTSETVRFDHVGLRYASAGEESLTDISFTVQKGQCVGIIGGTGSGKSSLVGLISRFYDATSGCVYLNGQPIASWPKEKLQQSVAVVQQEVRLFAGTIRSNLLWGNPDATEDQLWQALEMAQAADFVRKQPGQLDAEVEQGGRNLSGGQKQRLTIARALVRKADILILDDSASALDYATDRALRHALKTLPDSVTVFIVSQRTGTIAHGDLILVLEDGRLVGQGRHQELLENCSVYREIYESQNRKEGAQ